MLVKPSVQEMYPEIFAKTDKKREETMGSFTTATGIKVTAGTVGTDQRGALQEDARPDFVWFEDFENRKTLRSGRTTKSIWENMEEARTGLSKDGVCIYTCNYISEAGNVHVLVTKPMDSKKVLIVPITVDGTPTGLSAWPQRYTQGDIAQMIQDDEDFEGERLCKPSASKDVIFDRETLERMQPEAPKKITGNFKIFRPYDPSHRYGSGHDVAGGVGLDSSTSVFIDFSTVPARVVATYQDNNIKPDTFGHEIERQSSLYGDNLCAPETNNHGHATIAIAKQLEVNLFTRTGKDTSTSDVLTKEYGWHTNALTKPKMMFALAKAIEDGLLLLVDEGLIAEAKGYTRNDLIDTIVDPRLTTRHFDKLIACAIAWQMKDYAEVSKPKDDVDREMQMLIHQAKNKSSIVR